MRKSTGRWVTAMVVAAALIAAPGTAHASWFGGVGSAFAGFGGYIVGGIGNLWSWLFGGGDSGVVQGTNPVTGQPFSYIFYQQPSGVVTGVATPTYGAGGGTLTGGPFSGRTAYHMDDY